MGYEYSENRYRDVKIILILILGKWVVRMGCEISGAQHCDSKLL
jgi:hypothetical protein